MISALIVSKISNSNLHVQNPKQQSSEYFSTSMPKDEENKLKATWHQDQQNRGTEVDKTQDYTRVYGSS